MAPLRTRPRGLFLPRPVQRATDGVLAHPRLRGHPSCPGLLELEPDPGQHPRLRGAQRRHERAADRIRHVVVPTGRHFPRRFRRRPFFALGFLLETLPSSERIAAWTSCFTISRMTVSKLL